MEELAAAGLADSLHPFAFDPVSIRARIGSQVWDVAEVQRVEIHSTKVKRNECYTAWIGAKKSTYSFILVGSASTSQQLGGRTILRAIDTYVECDKWKGIEGIFVCTRSQIPNVKPLIERETEEGSFG